jgi:hypothetical protein
MEGTKQEMSVIDWGRNNLLRVIQCGARQVRQPWIFYLIKRNKTSRNLQ